MQKRRIGTISMAIVLIAFGVLIFIAQVSKTSAVELAIKFWPAILFLLGGEILWFSYKYKDEEIKVKYDILSVFIVLIIVFVNIIIYGLLETGMMNRINAMISSQTFNYQIPYNDVEVNDEIEKIIIKAPDSSSLTIRTDQNNKIVSSGYVNITADSEEKAKEFLDNEYIIINKSDNILYISFMDKATYSEFSNNIYAHNFTITIPEDRKVEINSGKELKLIADNIKNSWIIDNVRQTKIRLGKNTNTKINAFVENTEMLKGNVKWNVTKIGNEENSNIKGELVLGNGDSSINVLNSNELIVHELE
jgi:hypothetical protein